MWISAPPSAPLAAPPLPAVVRTSPNNRIDRRVIYLASLVIGAVLLVAGVGYRLVAGTDEGKTPVIQPEAPKPPPQIDLLDELEDLRKRSTATVDAKARKKV